MTVVTDDGYYKGVAAMLDALPERVVRYRVSDLIVSYCNAAWAAGHGLLPVDIIGRPLTDFLRTAAEQAGLESQLALLGPHSTLLADVEARPAPNLPGHWVEWVDQYLTGPDGPEVLAVGRDVTGRHIAEMNLANSEARFRDLADQSADVVWRFFSVPYPHLEYVSPSVENILGYAPSLFREDFGRFLEILDDDGRALIQRTLGGEAMPDRQDFRFRCADGSIVIGEMQMTRIRNGLQGVGRDVTELRRLQDELAELALRDPLTGLANRRLLYEMLDSALARRARTNAAVAVVFVDLDSFKSVNDTYGHEAGDMVLCETARRLVTTVRSADVVARLGGDEFVVVFEPDRNAGSEDVIERIADALAVPISISASTTLLCTASVGYADTHTSGDDRAALLAAADAAMYQRKKKARSPSAQPGSEFHACL